MIDYNHDGNNDIDDNRHDYRIHDRHDASNDDHDNDNEDDNILT